MNNGEIVELVIRRNNYSISELSRKLNVSRRSIYNWFTQKNLSIEVIYKIGEALGYDFSIDFPEIYHHKRVVDINHINIESNLDYNQNSANYWRNKYIVLLEKHNEILSDHQMVS